MKIIFFSSFRLLFCVLCSFWLGCFFFQFLACCTGRVCVCVLVLRLIITGARSCAKYFPSKLFQHFHCASVFSSKRTNEDAALTNTRALREVAQNWQTIRLLAPAREISCNICDVLLINATRENGENGIGGCPIMMMPNYWFPVVRATTHGGLVDKDSPRGIFKPDRDILRRSGEKIWLDLGSPTICRLLKARVIFRNFSIFN